ncbi:MAG: glutaminyl-peptide cyclotransferase [Phototrophicaceae bacterium]
MTLKRLSIAMIASILLTFVASAQDTPSGYATVTQLTTEVLNVYPHDANAFTQGLILHEGSFYESTGLRDQSTLREVAIETGEIVRSVDLTRTAEELQTQPNYFAEGLELVGDELIQLTWQSNVAFVYNVDTFEQTRTIDYEGEGWGLCYDDNYLYMSDSSEYLAIREPDTFNLIGRMLVTLQGRPIEAGLLNELECVGDYVYANLWRTDFIVQIDKYNGNIVGLIDAANLLTDEMIREIPNFTEDAAGAAIPPGGAVLNGIAYNPASDTFYITGKLWSRVFEVRFVPLDN